MKKQFMNFSIVGHRNGAYRSYRAEEGAAAEGGEGGAGTGAGTEEGKEGGEGTEGKFNQNAFMGEAAESGEEGAAEQDGGGAEGGAAAEVEFKPLPYWDFLVEDLSEEGNPFELPEEIKTGLNKEGKPLTIKEQYQLYNQIVADNTEIDATDETKQGVRQKTDPFVKSYLEAKEKGVTPEAFIKMQSQFLDISGLSNEDKVKQSYREYAKENKLEWSEDDISDKVDGLSKIDIDMQAKAFEQQRIAKQATAHKEYVESVNKQIDAANIKAEQENTNHINTYLKNIKGKTTLSGFEFGEADRTQYEKDLAAFVKRDKFYVREDGVKSYYSEAEEVLSNLTNPAKPQSSFEILPLLWMIKNNKLQGFSTRMKEQIKKTIDETLDNNPNSNRGNAGVQGFNAKGFMGE